MEIEGDLEFIVYLGALFDVFLFVFDVFLFYGLYMLGGDIMLCVQLFYVFSCFIVSCFIYGTFDY